MTDFIPSREICLTLMDQHGMLPQIKAHSLQVARVALCLGQNLIPYSSRFGFGLDRSRGLAP